MIQNRFNKLTNESNKGIVNAEDYKTTSANIVLSLLTFIDNLISSYSNYRNKFDKTFPNLKLDLKSCNREVCSDLFERAIGLTKNENVLHFIIYSEGYHQPISFIERKIFELDAKGYNCSIEYSDNECTNHIGYQSLPIRIVDIEFFRIKTKEIFGRRFGYSHLESLNGLIKTEYKDGSHDYIISVFQIDEKDWNKNTKKNIQWVIKDYCKDSGYESTQLLFFYVINKSSDDYLIKDRLKKTINNSLKEINRSPNCFLFSELRPLNKEDIINWAGKFMSNYDEKVEMAEKNN